MDRTMNMYERNKNYPSVAIWSLGNEAGNGYNFYQTYLAVKEKETRLMNRPVCYERALWEWNTDMYVPQYPTAGWLEETGRTGSDRPVVPSEYAHAMGNSTGNFRDQWQAIYKYPNLQGGFIWDWVDQGLLETDEDGREYWTYGGDYGTDMPSDGNFNCNGLVNPDRMPHPAMAEVKYAHQDFAIEEIDLDKGVFRITNRFYFTTSEEYTFSYRISANGKTRYTNRLAVPVIGPQQSVEITIPEIRQVKPQDGVSCFIDFEVTTKKSKRACSGWFHSCAGTVPGVGEQATNSLSGKRPAAPGC